MPTPAEKRLQADAIRRHAEEFPEVVGAGLLRMAELIEAQADSDEAIAFIRFGYIVPLGEGSARGTAG